MLGQIAKPDSSEKPGEDIQDPVPPPPGSVPEIKYLHQILDKSNNRTTISLTPPETQSNNLQEYDMYGMYVFTVVSKFIKEWQRMSQEATVLQINSSELIKTVRDVMECAPDIFWAAKPFRIDPKVFLPWIPELEQKATNFGVTYGQEDSPAHEGYQHLSLLLKYLKDTYSMELDKFSALVKDEKITFDLLELLFIPGKTLLYVPCRTTSEPRCVRLVRMALYDGSRAHHKTDPERSWALNVQYVEVDPGTPVRNVEELDIGMDSQPGQRTRFGYAHFSLTIAPFQGAKEISSLETYPIRYYRGAIDSQRLQERLIQRGRKWAEHAEGRRHVVYQGLAFTLTSERKSLSNADVAAALPPHSTGLPVPSEGISVDGKIMIDRKTLVYMEPNCDLPCATSNLDRNMLHRHAQRELKDEELLLTSPIVYGFSFEDKLWLQFVVDRVEDISWNKEAFEYLVIPDRHKKILMGLVKSHHMGPSKKFEDFVAGKGRGLVINLFGSPGVGKSLTAEAISEQLQRPLYVVGALDLQTGQGPEYTEIFAASLFKLSMIWGAIVLIDEADVFLEKRTPEHPERNATVAVFLRQLEYFRGILFLTTNRVREFDEAFNSRIHLSLRYGDLSSVDRRKIWVTFLKRVNGDDLGGITENELRMLGEKKVNGRQIKNIVRTAGALAQDEQKTLGFAQLEELLDLMEQFDASTEQPATPVPPVPVPVASFSIFGNWWKRG